MAPYPWLSFDACCYLGIHWQHPSSLFLYFTWLHDGATIVIVALKFYNSGTWTIPAPHLFPQRYYGNIVNPSGHWFQLKGWGHQLLKFFGYQIVVSLVPPCTNRCSPLLVIPHSWDADERDSNWDRSEEDNTSCPVHALVV